MSTHPLRWTSPPDNPTHHTRAYDPFEKYEYYMTNLHPPSWTPQRTVVVGARLSRSLFRSAEDLKSAWKALRYAHPILGCAITPHGFEFTENSPAEVDDWVDSTFFVISQDRLGGLTGREFSADLNHPTTTSECYFLEPTDEVVIQLRHEIVDGIGSFMLFNNFLKLLKSPESQLRVENPERLTPSMSEITDTPEPSQELTERTTEMVKRYLTSPPISLPMISPPRLSTPQSARYEHRFTKSQSSVLLKKCKELGITITHAVTAAIGLSILEISGINSGDFTPGIPINVRERFPPPFNTPDHAMVFAATAVLAVIPVTDSTPFLELAKNVKDVCEGWRNDKENIASHAVQAKIFEELVKSGVVTGSKFSGKATSTVSSLGIVERYLTEASHRDDEEEGGKGVEDFWIGQVTGNTKVVVFLYSFNGEVRVAACYNKRFHEDEGIKKFIETVVEKCYKGLGA